VLDIAKQTCEELEKVPFCDNSKLRELGSKYMSLVPEIDSSLRKHSGNMRAGEPSAVSDYALQTEQDVSRAAREVAATMEAPAGSGGTENGNMSICS
jgi:hypothetical protein